MLQNMFLMSVRGSDSRLDVVARLGVLNPETRHGGLANVYRRRGDGGGSGQDARLLHNDFCKESWARGCDTHVSKTLRLFPTGQPNQVDGYWWYGRGYCNNHAAYYRGWYEDSNWNTMSVTQCAELCNSEPQCMYFSYMVGSTCSRYNEKAKECPLFDDAHNWGQHFHHYTYRKKDFKVPRPETDLFKYLAGYQYVDQGHCHDGFYKGWKDKDREEMTVDKCKAHCDKEDNCAYFSVSIGDLGIWVCSRYSSLDKGCRVDLADWPYAPSYASYKKVEDSCPIESDVDFGGNDIDVGGWGGRFKGHLPSAEACRKVCDAMSACKSWTYHNSAPAWLDNCIPKSTTPSGGNRRENAIGYDSGAPCRD